jgi:hypothetical protein
VRVIVCGCRDWVDRQRLREHLTELLSRESEDEHTIVHGQCETGADYLASEWVALDHPVLRLRQEPHPAQWDRYDRAAGMIRNKEMANAGADLCVAFWDGKSRGTRNMIEQATLKRIPVVVVPK